jgi:uncharacterized protein (DUF305 family)
MKTASPVLINAAHPELYPLAGQIVSSQAEEMKQFKVRPQAWYGVNRPV